MCFLNDCFSIIHSSSITHLLHLLNNESGLIIYWDKNGSDLAEKESGNRWLINELMRSGSSYSRITRWWHKLFYPEQGLERKELLWVKTWFMLISQATSQVETRNAPCRTSRSNFVQIFPQPWALRRVSQRSACLKQQMILSCNKICLLCIYRMIVCIGNAAKHLLSKSILILVSGGGNAFW